MLKVTKPKPVAATPSDQLLNRVVLEHGRYIADGGKITLVQLIDPSKESGEVAQLLVGDSFDARLVKIGKGWNLRQLCEQMIVYLRVPACSEVVEVAAAGKSANAKPKKVKLPKERTRKMLRIPRQDNRAPHSAEVVPARRNEPDGLVVVRKAFNKRLFRYRDWKEILCNEVPENTLPTLLSLLRESSPRFIAELEKQLGARSIVLNHLQTILGEIRMADQLKLQGTPVKSRRVMRGAEHPRRAPARMKRAA